MDISFQGRNVHASTGGVAFDATKPVIVFLHGAGMDHTVWFLQSRWFAFRGRSVLALDFPGHGGSDGPTLSSIDAMASTRAGGGSSTNVGRRPARRPVGSGTAGGCS